MVRIQELDVLRGFAALNVVLFHYTTKFRSLFGYDFPDRYDWKYGQYGVELFFVISGFVIFMTLQDVKSVKEFAYKRFTRLYPTYWICLILTLSVMTAFPLADRGNFSTEEILINLSMVQGIFEVRNIDGAYWSLLPELLFYCLMAFIFQIKFLHRIKALAIVWLVLMIANKQYGVPFGAFFLNLKYGMFFLAGILFYRLKFEKGGLVEHLLINLCFATALFLNPTVECLLAYSCVFLLFYLFTYGKLKHLNLRPLIFLGYISYPLYLLHQNIGFVLIKDLKNYQLHEFLAIFICTVIMLGTAWVVTQYLEKPILNVLRNLYTEKKNEPATAPLVQPDKLDSLVR